MFLICTLSLFSLQISDQLSVVISVKIPLKQLNNDINFHFQFLFDISIGKSMIPVASINKIPNSWPILGVRKLWLVISQYILKFLASGTILYPLLYPVSVSDFTIHLHVLLCILIGDITSKSALLLFTLLSARKPQFKKHLIIRNCIDFSKMIHRGLFVIFQSILWGWVNDINYITIFVKLTKERYIFCHCILNYDDNHTYDTYVSYMYFIIICLTNFA